MTEGTPGWSPNICQACGRRRQCFQTRADARRVGRLIKGRRLRVYKCGRYFHLTSAPADRISTIRAGKASP